MNDRKELHKFIVEKFGGCWHETIGLSHGWCDPSYAYTCIKCGLNTYDKTLKKNLDLDTPNGFMWVWGKMREDDNRWFHFIVFVAHKSPHYEEGISDYYNGLADLVDLIDTPSRFIDAAEEFLKEEK